MAIHSKQLNNIISGTNSSRVMNSLVLNRGIFMKNKRINILNQNFKPETNFLFSLSPKILRIMKSLQSLNFFINEKHLTIA